MASIGGESVDILRSPAQPQDPEMDVKDITRPRVDGHAFIQIGKRGDEAILESVNYTTSPAALKATFRAMKSTLITIVLPDAQSVEEIMVHDVTASSEKKLKKVTGGSLVPTWRLVMAWRVQGTKV